MSNQAALIIAIGIAAGGVAIGGVYTAAPIHGAAGVFVLNRFTGTVKACVPAQGGLRCRLQAGDEPS